jgi:hypothetical protein
MIQNDCSNDVFKKIIYNNDVESFYVIFYNKMMKNKMIENDSNLKNY